MKILYSALIFSKDGCFRGFASGFNFKAISNIAIEESDITNILYIITDKEFSEKIPRHFLEHSYWKSSNNTEDIKIIDSFTIIEKIQEEDPNNDFDMANDIGFYGACMDFYDETKPGQRNPLQSIEDRMRLIRQLRKNHFEITKTK